MWVFLVALVPVLAEGEETAKWHHKTSLTGRGRDDSGWRGWAKGADVTRDHASGGKAKRSIHRNDNAGSNHNRDALGGSRSASEKLLKMERARRDPTAQVETLCKPSPDRGFTSCLLTLKLLGLCSFSADQCASS